MEIKLTFKITFTNSEETEQTITVPADPKYPVDMQTKALLQQMLGQYTTVGILREPRPGYFYLMCPSQIATIECELPSIVLAGANEVPKSPIITTD